MFKAFKTETSKPPTDGDGDTSNKPKGSLTRQTLFKTATSIGVVILASTGIGYFHLVSRITSQTLTQVEQYVKMRLQRERAIFTLAEDNHEIFKAALLERLEADGDRDPQEEFDRFFVRLEDGSVRNRSEIFDMEKTPGVFIGHNVEIDADMRRRVVAYYETLSAFSPAWRNRFANTYTQIPENGMVMYMHEYPWAMQAPSRKSFRVTDDESFQITRKIHDPERETVWTGIYYDQVADAWMASCVTPVDVDGRHIATIGHDILVDELLDRTISHTIEGTYNMIFRGDGRLVVHPDLMDRIQGQNGNFNIRESGDPKLLRIFELATQEGNNKVILDNREHDEYLAVTKIDEPDWYLVTVLPKSIVEQQALSTARLILLMGMVLLLVEILVVFVILRRQIAAPLTKLMEATENIAAGNLDIELDATRKDELGRLAYLFNNMAQQLRESFAALAKTNQELETRVEERTAELKEAKEVADAANHAKSEFLANMSHELRTPLNGVLGYTQILRRSSGLPEQVRHGLQVIHQCGSHLLTLIDDVLDISKIEARRLELHMEAFYLPSCLQGVVEICQIKAEQKDLQFIYEPPENLPSAIVADEKRLRQVLINLLGNAIKFTDTGNVTLEVEVRPDASDACMTCLHFSVRDTGVGISPEHIESIFHPFEQVGESRKKSEGTGLGLAITQKIVEMMGSSIRVQSELGVGSTFEFEISCPIATEWADTNSVTNNGAIRGYTGDRRQILIVDDRWENRSVVVNLLDPLGFTTLEASNGREGLEKAEDYQPDLIITDLQMPVMDGWEMLDRIRHSETLKDALVVVSSASVFSEDRQKSLDSGGDDFLAKPVHSNELYRMLEKYLHLKWIYDREPEKQPTATKSESLEIVPPASELTKLHKYASDGHIKGIQEELEKLATADKKYQPFVDRLNQPLQQFNIQKIRQILQEIAS